MCYLWACGGLSQLGEQLEEVLTTVHSLYIFKTYHCMSLGGFLAAAAAGGLLSTEGSHQ